MKEDVYEASPGTRVRILETETPQQTALVIDKTDTVIGLTQPEAFGLYKILRDHFEKGR